jgi:hypothetical protein
MFLGERRPEHFIPVRIMEKRARGGYAFLVSDRSWVKEKL